mmetsp:Transcript_14740/g.31774  ORF Transcript_14740/g.31774 Transcript_14740/m.31774 type:complete len:204 (+) Transcript_14740:1024-1635(+)
MSTSQTGQFSTGSFNITASLKKTGSKVSGFSRLRISDIGLDRAFLSMAHTPSRIRLATLALVAVVLELPLLLVRVSVTGSRNVAFLLLLRLMAGDAVTLACPRKAEGGIGEFGMDLEPGGAGGRVDAIVESTNTDTFSLIGSRASGVVTEWGTGIAFDGVRLGVFGRGGNDGSATVVSPNFVELRFALGGVSLDSDGRTSNVI